MAQETQRLAVRNNLVLIGIYTFMGVCLFLASVLAFIYPLPYAENPLIMKVGMGYLGLPVSIAVVALNVRKLVSRRHVIVIDEKGITDYTTALSSGFTAWEDLREVFLLRLHDDTYLCAVPNDYDAWLGQLSKRQRRLAEANVDAGFAPIRIQFKKVTDSLRAEDGLAAVKRFCPKKVTRTRKPKY